MYLYLKFVLVFAIVVKFFTCTSPAYSQKSIARQWNEIQLFSIKNDYTRPTVQARNLHHVSAAMYDAWAAYDSIAQPYFLGKTVNGYYTPFTTLAPPVDKKDARTKAISYAAYRLMLQKYGKAPKRQDIFPVYHKKMLDLGFDTSFVSTDYTTGDPRALGNYIAHHIIQYGLQDGSNEQNDYKNIYYKPVNPPLKLDTTGTSGIVNLNRWQPLRFNLFIDQGGNINPDNVPAFLGAEWGNLAPFSLDKNKVSILQRDSNEYKVYHDPGHPPYIEGPDTTIFKGLQNFYKYGHLMTAQWSTHLDKENETLWDISPKSIGNTGPIPKTPEAYLSFYDFEKGGAHDAGYQINPKTGQPYQSQWVKRADYARVLAEYWADGPDSETPPGHWFSIFNRANDHPAMVRKFNGHGPLMDTLEWDIKVYFALGGAVHDASIAAWSVKGYYDYVRPISAIRGMAELGQSSDPELPRYHKDGLPLIPDFVELVTKSDPLVGFNQENLWELKIKAWRGYNFLTEDNGNVAGVGWILAKNFVPYQRATFVTPPFGGYVSGHSTFSRAAAELLTLFTGDAFFPGGLAEYHAPANTFLIHESGPTQDVTLQWATYRDAADQCSLSRIWGGIHPPQDDIPGRIIGEKTGKDAFAACVPIFYSDHDNDGYYSYLDCDDFNPNINPNTIWFADLDGDGFVNIQDSIIECTKPKSFILLSDSKGLDCDDSNPNINPNTIWFADLDGDRYVNTQDSLIQCTKPVSFILLSDGKGLDCDDSNTNINPEAIEIANNGIDDDCNGEDLISSLNSVEYANLKLYPTILRPETQLFVSNPYPETFSLIINDMVGKSMVSEKIYYGTSVLPIANLHSGVYLITMIDQTQRKIKTLKVVVI